MKLRALTGLLSCALALELLLAASAWLLRQTGRDPVHFQWLLPVTLLSFIPYFIAVWQARQLEWRQIRGLVIVVAVLARATLLPTPLLLSDDAIRYLWDGRIQLHGFNPYRDIPDSPELTGLRDDLWKQVTHRDIPTVYPPLLLLVFRGAAVLSADPAVFKFIFTVFDLVALWLLVRLLRARGQNESFALVWAWSPLVMLEFAGSGHEMSLAICFFLSGLLYLQGRPRFVAAAGCFALAAGVHYLALPLIVATVLATRLRSWQFWVTFVILLALPYLVFADAGQHLFWGVTVLATRWRFNGSLFELFNMIEWGFTLPIFGALQVLQVPVKILVAVALFALLRWVWRHRPAPARASFLMIGALLLLSSTVHPWYFTWIVALGCLEFSVAWLSLSAFVVASYVAKLTELEFGQWTEITLVRWLEYTPFFALLAWELWHQQRAREATQPERSSANSPDC